MHLAVLGALGHQHGLFLFLLDLFWVDVLASHGLSEVDVLFRRVFRDYLVDDGIRLRHSGFFRCIRHDFLARNLILDFGFLGGDPAAGLRLSERMAARGMKVDAVLMDGFRRSNAAEHARRIRALQAAQAERERAEARAEDEAQRAAQKEALRLPPVRP